MLGRIAELPDEVNTEFEAVESAEQPHAFARHVAVVVERVLREVRDDAERLALANRLLAELAADEVVATPSRHLTAVRGPVVPGHAHNKGTRPATPLSEAALLTNAKGEPNLGAELRAELGAADGVDLLCAFVKWHGLRVIDEQLRALRDRRVPFRVITTTYMGATERRALDRLVREFGAEVRIHYDEATTRLHAKAWLFHRATGYDTAYVGSSNLSRAALLDGLEWNVRLSRVGTPALLEKFGATFETYWNDPSFEPYDPDNQDQRDRLDDALSQASGRGGPKDGGWTISGLEVRPYAYQQHILDTVQAERELHGRHRNLVVAATGTGKTVIAALDYKRLADPETKRYPSLLFVAHRKEILEQSRRTYCEVLGDPNFGELYVDGSRPERWQHVFASIQSLNSYGVKSLEAAAFEVVVVDEFHHAAATTYQGLLEHMQPRELLALTATPERADGFDVRAYFDGRTAAELRLWEALQAGILCPFHYFMVSDGTDLSTVAWTRGRYDEASLQKLYTGNDARARVILKELGHKVSDVHQMKALGFCVGVAHARYMARVFNDAGIAARAVSGDTPRDERRDALAALRSGTVQVLFAADLFNEGVDIPDVDTLLFLRPTESATVFLQQLGRGLRSRPDKPVLTVLDFVGNQRREFRFDAKLSALTGRPRGRLRADIEEGFPYLPSGSQVVLDERSQEVVLENLRTQISARWPSLVQQLAAMGPGTSLSTFLDDSGLALADVLRRGQRSWAELQADATHSPALTPLEVKLGRRARALAHVDDPQRHRAYGSILQGASAEYEGLSGMERRLADMLFFSLWPDGGGFDSVGEGLRSLGQSDVVRASTWEVIDEAFDQADHPVRPLTGRLADVPLHVHGRYQREEVLAALGYASTARKPNSFREGVLYVPELNVDAFFVTLRKTDDSFSPTTMYRDYPISRDLFHWESQSVTTAASRTGQRYLTGTSTVLIFVREEKKDDFGTSPYLLLGPARYLSHEGERPIAITWRLDVPMPADFFASAAVAAG
nr:DEAD/DEAH box helicase [Ornithinimicrobium murale]